MSCPECFEGYVRKEASTGTVTTLHGLPTYVAEPSEGRAVKGIIVIVPDAFGWEFINNRLLADEYARAGDFKVLLPEFMNGKACPVWVTEPLDTLLRTESIGGFVNKFSDNARAIHGFGPFLYNTRLSVTMPRVTDFLTNLRKAEGAKFPVGIAGFCWGGQHVIQLSSSSSTLVDVCFTAHPSGLSFPKDIEGIRKPFSVAIGDQDPLMTPKQVKETEAVLKKNGVEFEVVVYEGAGHGFSVRIDRKNPTLNAQAMQAEAQAVNWFTKNFKKMGYSS